MTIRSRGKFLLSSFGVPDAVLGAEVPHGAGADDEHHAARLCADHGEGGLVRREAFLEKSHLGSEVPGFRRSGVLLAGSAVRLAGSWCRVPNLELGTSSSTSAPRNSGTSEPE